MNCPQTSAAIAADARLAADDVLVVWKAERRIAHYERGQLSTRDGLVGCWQVALAPDAPLGPKQREGDNRTPEGWYWASDKPSSRFPLAITVHYPNLRDADAGLAAGTIDATTHGAIALALAAGAKPPQNTALGGEILIHGGGSAADWTLGCIALETAELSDLRARLPPGMAVHVLILP